MSVELLGSILHHFWSLIKMGMSMLVIFLHFKFTAPIGQDKSIFHGCRSHLNRWIELADLLAWERGVRWFKSITHDEWPSRVTPLARFSQDQIKKAASAYRTASAIRVYKDDIYLTAQAGKCQSCTNLLAPLARCLFSFWFFSTTVRKLVLSSSFPLDFFFFNMIPFNILPLGLLHLNDWNLNLK